MFVIDVGKVKGKIAEKGYNNSSFASKLQINRNTLSEYLKFPSKIPYWVISEMALLLCDNEREACEIFFAKKLT